MIKKIYEIQDKGKGLIEAISPDNLLLVKEENITPGLEEVINSDPVLSLYHIIDVQVGLDITSDDSGIRLWNDFNANNSDTPNVRIGRHITDDSTGVNLSFFTNSTIFRDNLNNKGLEYAGDYESNFTDRSLVTKQYADSLVTTGALDYKIYTVVLDQVSTANPTSTVLGTNTIGSIVWTRNAVGTYHATLTGAFTNFKSFHFISKPAGLSDTNTIRGVRSSDNVYQISTHNSGGTAIDSALNSVLVELRVYN